MVKFSKIADFEKIHSKTSHEILISGSSRIRKNILKKHDDFKIFKN